MTTNEDQSRTGGGNASATCVSAGGEKSGNKSSSPQPSPSSGNNAQIRRGRSRTRGVGSNREEQNGLRRFVCFAYDVLCLWLKRFGTRGYHALHSSFGKVFNVEKRWKIIREMGSGAYGFVVFVGSCSFSPSPPGALF